MRFPDFLKATVLTSATAATVLAALTAIVASRNGDALLVPLAAGWWLVATALGAMLGRRAETTPPIARLLANARPTQSLPEVWPGRILLNRLWPLLACTILAGAVSLWFPQVAAIASGFGIIWALSWRRQDAAVAAIEGRDGVRYYVQRTSPLRPIQLVRTPGFRTGPWEREETPAVGEPPNPV